MHQAPPRVPCAVHGALNRGGGSPNQLQKHLLPMLHLGKEASSLPGRGPMAKDPRGCARKRPPPPHHHMSQRERQLGAASSQGLRFAPGVPSTLVGFFLKGVRQQRLVLCAPRPLHIRVVGFGEGRRAGAETRGSDSAFCLSFDIPFLTIWNTFQTELPPKREICE